MQQEQTLATLSVSDLAAIRKDTGLPEKKSPAADQGRYSYK